MTSGISLVLGLSNVTSFCLCGLRGPETVLTTGAMRPLGWRSPFRHARLTEQIVAQSIMVRIMISHVAVAAELVEW